MIVSFQPLLQATSRLALAAVFGLAAVVLAPDAALACHTYSEDDRGQVIEDDSACYGGDEPAPATDDQGDEVPAQETQPQEPEPAPETDDIPVEEV